MDNSSLISSADVQSSSTNIKTPIPPPTPTRFEKIKSFVRDHKFFVVGLGTFFLFGIVACVFLFKTNQFNKIVQKTKVATTQNGHLPSNVVAKVGDVPIYDTYV